MAINFQGSVLLVADMFRSRAFYEQVLGQTVKENIQDINVAFDGFALWERGYASQVIWGAMPDKMHNRAMELYFECDELPALISRLEEHGVKWLQSLQEAPWGQLSMRVEDPDGNVVEIGEPIICTVRRMAEQGMNELQVSERTGLPPEAVQGMYPK